MGGSLSRAQGAGAEAGHPAGPVTPLQEHGKAASARAPQGAPGRSAAVHEPRLGDLDVAPGTLGCCTSAMHVQ